MVPVELVWEYCTLHYCYTTEKFAYIYDAYYSSYNYVMAYYNYVHYVNFLSSTVHAYICLVQDTSNVYALSVLLLTTVHWWSVSSVAVSVLMKCVFMYVCRLLKESQNCK